MKRTKIKYCIDNMSTDLLQEIVVDRYARHLKNGEIRDYWDQREDIEILLYTRRSKDTEAKFSKHQDLVQKRLEHLQSLLPLLQTKFKSVRYECNKRLIEETKKLGLSEFDLYQEIM